MKKATFLYFILFLCYLGFTRAFLFSDPTVENYVDIVRLGLDQVPVIGSIASTCVGFLFSIVDQKFNFRDNGTRLTHFQNDTYSLYDRYVFEIKPIIVNTTGITVILLPYQRFSMHLISLELHVDYSINAPFK
ncbi:hypothetical protein ACTA71_000741 [Dictyostelium dimigraforme]